MFVCLTIESCVLVIAPEDHYLFKVNYRNTKTRYEIYLKLTTKTPERRQWRISGVFIVNFEHIRYLALVL